MKYYLKVYTSLLKANFAMITVYKSYFYSSVIVTCLWGLFQIFWMALLTSKIQSFHGWSRYEMLLIAANYIFIVGFFHMFFSRNFDRLSLIVNKGDLDLILVKPIDAQFATSLWIFNYANFFRIFIGLGIIIFLVIKAGITVTATGIVGWLIMIFFSIILTYSIWLIFSTFIIRYPKLSNINELLYNINGVSRFPPELVYEMRSFIFFVLIPFTLSAAIPTKALFARLMGQELTLFVSLSVGLFVFSRYLWKSTLRFYTSASS